MAEQIDRSFLLRYCVFRAVVYNIDGGIYFGEAGVDKNPAVYDEVHAASTHRHGQRPKADTVSENQ